MMDFKSSQEDFKNEISELVTHIKHLSENWEVNLTGILDRYLKLVQEFSKDNIVSLDFSVAAMLLQMSGKIYSKKVDYVWKQLIHLQELLTSSINIEQNAEENADVPAKPQKRVTRTLTQTFDSDEFEELKVKTSMNVQQKKGRKSSSKPHKLSYDFLRTFSTTNTPVFSNLTLLDFAGERIGESKDFRVNSHLDQHCRLENPLETIEPGDVDLGDRLSMCESSEEPVFDAISSTEFMVGFDQMESEDHLENPLLKQATLPQPDQAMLPLDVNPSSPVGSERCVGQEGREGEGREVLASSLSDYSGSEWPISSPGEELPRKSVNKKKSCVKKRLSKKDRLSTSDWDPLGDHILGCLKGLRLTMLPELTVQKLEYQRLLKHMSNLANRIFQGDIQAFLRELAQDDEEDFIGFLNPPLESSELGVDDGLGPSLLGGYVDNDMEDNNCFGEELGAPSPGPSDLPLSQDYQPSSGKETSNRANPQTNQLLEDPNEQAKRREEMYQRVEKWEQYVTPLLVRAHTRDNFNIDEFESRVLAAFPAPLVNSKLTFKQLMATRPTEDVSRYFLACLMLAKAGNIEITTSGEGDGRMDTVELTLLSLARRQDQMEEDCSKMTASNSGGHRGKKKKPPKLSCRKMEYQRNSGSRAGQDAPSSSTRCSHLDLNQASVSTRTSEPSVSTRTSEPSVSTRTSEPSVSTRTCEQSLTRELSSRINGFNPNSTSTPLPVKSPLFDKTSVVWKTRHANHLDPGVNNSSSDPKSVSLSCLGTRGHSLDSESSSSDSSYGIPKRKKKKKKKSMD